MHKDWPLVHEKDDGIRPAVKPGVCFYCQQKIGQTHGHDCVVVKKRVKIRYVIDVEVEVDVPYSWTKKDIEFHRNDSSWCADNALEEINAQADACLCGKLTAKFIGVVDDTPRREITK